MRFNLRLLHLGKKEKKVLGRRIAEGWDIFAASPVGSIRKMGDKKVKKIETNSIPGRSNKNHNNNNNRFFFLDFLNCSLKNLILRECSSWSFNRG